ncbi:MAG: hypothetical protein HYY04_19005 [Chloroflexi bacterium]|nr:hypothetical protein [Chloroflexota bacterium]
MKPGPRVCRVLGVVAILSLLLGSLPPTLVGQADMPATRAEAPGGVPAVAPDVVPIHPATGGELRSADGKTTIRFPAGAVAVPATARLSLITGRAPHWPFDWQPYAFDVDVRDAADSPLKRFNRPVTVAVAFADDDVRGLGRTTLALYSYDETARQWVKLPSQVDLRHRTVSAATTHFSPVGLWGEPFLTAPAAIKSFQTDLFPGSASFSYPLEVMPGPNGLQPRLNLTYSSASVDEMKSANSRGSWVGVGWHLDLGAITYNPQRGTFSLKLDEVGDELVDLGNGYYRTKKESFIRIQKVSLGDTWQLKNNLSWVIWSKDGTAYRFGQKVDTNTGDWTNNGDGTHRGVDGSRHFYADWGTDGAGRWGYVRTYYRWDLDSVQDPHGNALSVSYRGVADQLNVGPECTLFGGQNGECVEWNTSSQPYDRSSYPYEIRYSLNDDDGAGGAAPRRTIRFSLSSRPDTPSGVQTFDTHRLDAIRMYLGLNAETLVRTYAFGYDTSSSTQLRLASVTLSGADGTSALPATTLTYENKDIRYHDPSNNIWRTYSQPRLVTVANGYGGRVTFSYREDPDLTYRLAWSRQIVERRTVSDGLSNDAISTYTSAGWQHYKPAGRNWEETEFRGYNVVTVTDPAGHVSHHRFHQGVVGDGDTTAGPQTLAYEDGTTFADRADLEGKPYEEDQHEGTGPALARQVSLWSASSGGFVHLDEVRTFRGSRRATTTYQYDPARQNGAQYGNRTDIYAWGEADPATGQWYRHTQTEYFPRTDTAYLVDRPARVRVWENNGANGDGDWRSETWYTYDGNLTWNSLPGTRGLLTAIRRNSELGLVDVSYGYDGSGNRIRVTEHDQYGTSAALGASPRTTTIDYDPLYHTFPITTTNPLGQPEIIHADPATGQLADRTDANGATWRYQYDSLQRIVAVRSPSEGPNDPATVIYEYDTASTPYQLLTKRRQDDGGANPADSVVTRQFFDGFGQLVQEYADHEQPNGQVGFTVKNIHYDPRGLLAWESVPRLVASGSSFARAEWDDTAKPRRQEASDGLGRLGRVTNPDGSFTERTYDGWGWAVVDENNHRKRFEQDAFGRLSRVREDSGTNPWTEYAVTSYAYDVGDNLRFVTDAAGNVTELRYDKRGRKTDLFDPDLGHWVYTSDADGNLRTQTDAKGQTITFVYDALNRLTRKESPVGTALASYAYDGNHGDATSAAVGRRTGMTDGSGSTKWYYDQRGRVTREEKTVVGDATYTTRATFNALDQVRTVTYPDGEVVTTSYDAATRLKTVSGSAAYLASAAYNAPGQLKTLGLNGGTISTKLGYHGYNAAGLGDAEDAPGAGGLASLGRLWRITTVAGGATLQSLEHGYDAVGNVTRVADTRAGNPGGRLTFGYDHRDRLVSAAPEAGSANGYQETYTYSRLGNITAKNGVPWSYESARPHVLSATRDTRLVQDGFSSTANWAPQNGSVWSLDAGRYRHSSFAFETFGSTANWAPQNGATWSLEGGEYSNQSAIVEDFTAHANNWQPVSGSWSWEVGGTYRGVSAGGWGFTYHPTAGATTGYADFWATLKQVAANSGGMSLIVNWQDSNNFYMAELWQNNVFFLRRQGGVFTNLGSAPFPWSADTWYTVKVSVQASTYRVYVNGTRYLTITDSTFGPGKVGLGADTGTFAYDNVKVFDWKYTLYSSQQFNSQDGEYVVDGKDLATGEDRGSMTLILRWQDSNNHYKVGLWGGALFFAKKQNGLESWLSYVLWSSAPNTWYRLRVNVAGTTYRVYVNDALLLTVSDGTFTTGKAGLGSFAGHLHYDNFLVRELEYAKLNTGQTFGNADAQVEVATQNETGSFAVGLAYRWQDVGNHYFAEVWDQGVYLWRKQGGWFTNLAYAAWTAPITKLRVRMEGANFRLYVDDAAGEWVKALEVNDGTFGSGPIALGSWGATNRFDNVLVTELPTPEYGYDGNGNLVSGGGRTLSWDVENRLSSLTVAGQTTTYGYDGDGALVKKVGPSGTTVYVGKVWEKDLGTGEERKHYFAGGRRIAVRETQAGGSSQVFYLLGDNLGGTVGLVNASDLSQQESRYYSYGESRTSTTGLPTDRLYAGYRLEGGPGLYQVGARWYDPALGRFIQPDTIVPDPQNPQALNRYAYALNNPLKYRDPSGHWVETAWDVGNIIWDAYEVSQEPSLLNIGALVVDVGATLLPFVPAGAGMVVRAGKTAKAANEVVSHADDVKDVARLGSRAADFGKVAHIKGSNTLLNKLLHPAPRVAQGAEYELEFAVAHADEVEEIGRVLEVVKGGAKEIDFVRKGNVFVNVKNYDWTKYNDVVLKFETETMVKQAKEFFKYNPTAVEYVFKGGVPDSVRQALEAAGIVVQVWP